MGLAGGHRLSLAMCERMAHLARPWMPAAPRARHCARSFSTLMSAMAMLLRGSVGS